MITEKLLATPQALAAYRNDPFYHRAVDVVRTAEVGGGDPVAILCDALLAATSQLLASRERETQRLREDYRDCKEGGG